MATTGELLHLLSASLQEVKIKKKKKKKLEQTLDAAFILQLSDPTHIFMSHQQTLGEFKECNF